MRFRDWSLFYCAVNLSEFLSIYTALSSTVYCGKMTKLFHIFFDYNFTSSCSLAPSAVLWACRHHFLVTIGWKHTSTSISSVVGLWASLPFFFWHHRLRDLFHYWTSIGKFYPRIFWGYDCQAQWIWRHQSLCIITDVTVQRYPLTVDRAQFPFP